MKVFITFFLFSILIFPMAARGVQVSPLVRVYGSKERTGVLTVSNVDGDKPVSYEITVDEMAVVDGTAVRSASQKIRFSPAVFTVQPGKTQLVRFLKNSDGAGEEFFRVHLQQVMVVADKNSGLTPVVNFDFPWIWRSADSQPKLYAIWTAGGLRVVNTGNAAAQLASLSAGAEKKNGLVGYVLPGESRLFDSLKDFPHVSVRVQVNGIEQELVPK